MPRRCVPVVASSGETSSRRRRPPAPLSTPPNASDRCCLPSSPPPVVSARSAPSPPSPSALPPPASLAATSSPPNLTAGRARRSGARRRLRRTPRAQNYHYNPTQAGKKRIVRFSPPQLLPLPVSEAPREGAPSSRLTPFYCTTCAVKKLQEYVDDINGRLETKLHTRGPVSKYVLPDENLRGRLEITFDGDVMNGGGL